MGRDGTLQEPPEQNKSRAERAEQRLEAGGPVISRGTVASVPSISSMPLTLLSKRRRLSLSDLILRAVCFSSGRRGTSLVVIKKVLIDEGYDVQRNSSRLKAALKSLINKRLLERVTGSGAAGSFRIGPIGRERLDRNTRRGRAAGESRRRRRRAKKTKERKNVVNASSQRLKKPCRPGGTARAVPVGHNRAEDADEGAEVAEAAMEGAAGGVEVRGGLLVRLMEQ
ncbi:histone H1t-like [Pezoporus flaviventris]|uniref:histone H1t-like n=1 Tax=Pezoporus flaviventris TaxID=889875 RepID=UPI002AB217F6|nr:histone H1t-like [Pezoporus flaviventris]